MDILSIIAIIVSIFAVIVAFLSWNNSKRTTLHHVLEDIRKDYRSPEMHHAVKTLWEFYRDCQSKGEDFVEKYFQILKNDNQRLSSLKENEKIKAERDTLHYQRRLVSHFYQYVASLYVNKILPGKVIFKAWIEDDLRIIPNIIIPIEKRLPEIIKTPKYQPINNQDIPWWLSPLFRLYIDSKKASKGNNYIPVSSPIEREEKLGGR
jgi:hypothetical protein